jgi:hypothetical protein
LTPTSNPDKLSLVDGHEIDRTVTNLMEHLYDRMMRGFAKEARALIEPHFSEETAQPGSWMSQLPSSGHCVLASMFVFIYLGARCSFVSTEIGGQSHWWIKCHDEYAGAEIDITADQFGEPPILVAVGGEGLRPDSQVKIRSVVEIDKETKERFILLMSRVTEIDFEEAKRYLLTQ